MPREAPSARSIGSRRRIPAIALSIAILLTALATTAHALPDVGETEDGSLDTRQTPVAKEPPDGLFTHWAGAEYDPEGPSPDDLIEGSPTPLEAELLAVDFQDKENGFAAGTLAQGDGAKLPVIYGYRELHGDGEWSEAVRFDGSGYVAAITQLPGGRALAVGGDGSYPHREPAYSEDEQAYCQEGEPPPIDKDPAGRARAWLYEGGSWQELLQLSDGTEGDELPDEMGALTAVDAYRNDGKLRDTEFAVAGGLCQLWHWKDGGFLRESDGSFAEPFSNQSPPPELPGGIVPSSSPIFGASSSYHDPSNFSYRIRELVFATYSEDRSREERPLLAYAVTSGCCAPDRIDENNRRALLLEYKASGNHAADGTWVLPAGSLEDTYAWTDAKVKNTTGPCLYPFGATDTTCELGETVDGLLPVDREEIDPDARGARELPQHRDAQPKELVPDSFYSVTATQATSFSADVGMILSPGAEQSDLEPGSVLTGSEADECRISPAHNTAALAGVCVPPHLTSTRLIDGDGDVGGRTKSELPPVTGTGAGQFMPHGDSAAGSPDGIPDWSVGELTSRGQAAALSTDPAQLPQPDSAVQDPPTEDTVEEVQSYEATNSERGQGSIRSYDLLKLPTYRLNAIDVLDRDGVGWAVGNHGAIVKLTVDKTEIANELAGARRPPRLGASKPGRLPDGSTYESYRPEVAGSAEAVPPLATRPLERFSEPEVRSAGWADPDGHDVRDIVMSRDGGEGWAIGSGGRTVLHRYDGTRWTRCEAQRIEGQLSADPACKGLADVYEQKIALQAAARVPLENDADPTNDDQFEVVVAGRRYRDPETGQLHTLLLHYRGGLWELEDQEVVGELPATVESMVFTGPGDGWAVDGGGEVFRLLDGRWVSCTAQKCDDDETGRLWGGLDDHLVRGLAGAGDRVYAYGFRYPDSGTTAAIDRSFSLRFPMIVYRERGKTGWHATPAHGGYDPAYGHTGPEQDPPPQSEQGEVDRLAVLQQGDRDLHGWAVGRFGVQGAGNGLADIRQPDSTLLRMEPGGGWRRFRDHGALADYGERISGGIPMVGTGPDGRPMTLMGDSVGRMFAFDAARERWESVPSLQPPNFFAGDGVAGEIQALAPTNAGGIWIAVNNNDPGSTSGPVTFFRYSTHHREPVFEEMPGPVEEENAVTDLDGSADGTVWLSTDSDKLFRYDRVLGWDRVRIPGWDPGRIVTRASEVNAVAVGPDGEGVAVGREGRIARLSDQEVRLDEAAGTACDLTAPSPPCGTAFDLTAADVAPDGSAIAAGEGHALLWRPAGGEFRAIATPQLSRRVQLTAVAMPAPGKAWLAAANGVVFAGQLAADDQWSWQAENLDRFGDPITVDYRGTANAIRDIALDESGRGLAVGDHGTVLERTGDDDEPWRRVGTGALDNLTSVALSAGGGHGALIGGNNGVVLTLDDGGFQIARPADFAGGSVTGSAVGVAVVPGTRAGETEAWAAIAPGSAQSNVNRILHYSSDPDEPLLSPDSGAAPLRDAPPTRSGELDFAAFGKQECSLRAETPCPDFTGVSEEAQVVSERIREDILAAGDGEDPSFALFAGGAVDSGGLPGGNAVHERGGEGVLPSSSHTGHLVAGRAKLRSWRQRIADGFDDAGVPLLGALGAQDLSESGVCDDLNQAGGGCYTTRQAKLGDNIAWRNAMESRPAPWGSGEEVEADGYALKAVEDPARRSVTGPQQIPDAELGDPSGGTLGEQSIRTGQARTHYAADVVSQDGEPAARIVVADNSLRSFAASDPQQQPAEPAGQAAWLERMLCRAPGRAPTGERCTRQEDQPAVVLANTPTYSYGPGALTETTQDSTAFEAIVLRHRVSAVVSGRIGWNGLYYALAPGLHWPCPGGSYPEKAPKPGQAPDCTGQSTSQATGTPNPELPSLEDATGLSGATPFVVAAGGGGKFSSDATGGTSASDGFWHGYSVIRISPDGDPRKTIVEQRPVYDWIAIRGGTHTVRAREKARLLAIGRGPISTRLQPGIANSQTARLDEIESPAITHRFALLLADPQKPWLPLQASAASPAQLSAATDAQAPPGVASAAESNPCHPYVCLDPEVGQIDHQTGQVKAGGGNQPLTYAIAMLSVGEHVATYPLAFEPSPSFRASPPVVPRPNFAGASVAPPSAPSAPSVPQVPNVSVPTPPVPPALVPPPPAPPAAPPKPPVPPPVPPADAGPSPLSLSFAPTGLVVAPTASVIPPPAPPINPAPPGGARREARQRQAATQKSGADSAEGEGSDAREMGGDTAQSSDTVPGSSGMSRYENGFTRRGRHTIERSFTALAADDQPSAWARGALYGGGMTLMAAALAFGWSTTRPRSRRGEPDVPAPASALARNPNQP